MERTTSYRPPLNRRSAGAVANGSNKLGRCPYLGTSADPGTALAFASDANHCYRTRLPVPISNIHQESYCLAAHYDGCPVFRQNLHLPEIVPLAAVAFAPEPDLELRTADLSAPVYDTSPMDEELAIGGSSRSVLRPIVAGLLLVALLFAGWWVLNNFLADRAGETETAAGQTSETGLAFVPPARDLLPTSEPPLPPTSDAAAGAVAAGGVEGAAAQLPAATPTPLPTATQPAAEAPTVEAPVARETVLPTATALPATDITPTVAAGVACAPPEWWTPYVVRNGETLPGLAFARGIPLREVLAANCLSSLVVSAGMTILLPPVAVVALPGAGVGGGLPLPPQPPGPGLPIIVPGPVGTAPTSVPGPGLSGPQPTRAAPATPRPPQPTSVAPTATPPAFPTATAPVQPEITKTPPGGNPTAVPPTSTPPAP
jgi:hypothetical protein